MGLIRNITDTVKRYWSSQPYNETVTYTGSPGFWNSFGLPHVTESGRNITPEIAMGLGVVYACVYKISSTLASLPVFVYRDEAVRFERLPHTTDYLLNKSPDDIITAFDFRETLIAMSLLFGKGYARIYRDRNGDAYRLQLIHPTSVTERIIDGVAYVEIKGEKDSEFVPVTDMICVKYLLGRSPVMQNRETIGLLDAAQQYASKFFAGGGVMNGVLTSDQNLKQEQIDALLDTWAKQAGRQTRFMPFGVKYQQMSVEPDKAQNVDSRKFQAEEICRVFNVPPAMIGLNGGAYKDYENQAKAFVTNTIAPFAERIENEMTLKLLPRNEREVMTYRHNLDELMRGDSVSRASFYNTMLQSGVFSINEVRAKERMNGVNGGDLHAVQINQIALDSFSDYSNKVSSDE